MLRPITVHPELVINHTDTFLHVVYGALLGGIYVPAL